MSAFFINFIAMKNFIHIGAFEVGHSYGLDPTSSIDQMIKENMNLNLEALIQGFTQGREDYEKYNGTISIEHIPPRTVTLKVLSEAMLEGSLGMQLDKDDYNEHQLLYLEKWHERGALLRNIDNEITLGVLLQEIGIN